MDNTKELIIELSSRLNISRRKARQMIAAYYGKKERTVYDWTDKGGIYEYGLIKEAVDSILKGHALHDSIYQHRFEMMKSAYHDYTGYDSSQERTVMLFFAFECIEGGKVFTEKELIERTGVPRSTLFKCVARLIEKGMLQREKNESGGVIYSL